MIPNIIDTHIITKTINLGSTLNVSNELKILVSECLKWAESKEYDKNNNYILYPTFTIKDRLLGLIEYKLEVLEFTGTN